MSNKVKFKKPQDYQKERHEMQATDKPTAADASTLDGAEDPLQKALITFFDHLFKVSADDETLEDARKAFKQEFLSIKKLPPKTQRDISNQIDFFVGRVRINIVDLLIAWHHSEQ